MASQASTKANATHSQADKEKYNKSRDALARQEKAQAGAEEKAKKARQNVLKERQKELEQETKAVQNSGQESSKDRNVEPPDKLC